VIIDFHSNTVTDNDSSTYAPNVWWQRLKHVLIMTNTKRVYVETGYREPEMSGIIKKWEIMTSKSGKILNRFQKISNQFHCDFLSKGLDFQGKEFNWQAESNSDKVFSAAKSLCETFVIVRVNPFRKVPVKIHTCCNPFQAEITKMCRFKCIILLLL